MIIQISASPFPFVGHLSLAEVEELQRLEESAQCPMSGFCKLNRRFWERLGSLRHRKVRPRGETKGESVA